MEQLLLGVAIIILGITAIVTTKRIDEIQRTHEIDNDLTSKVNESIIEQMGKMYIELKECTQTTEEASNNIDKLSKAICETHESSEERDVQIVELVDTKLEELCDTLMPKRKK